MRRAAKTSIRLQTPYFLPDPGLVTALCGAALRGVKVNILLPGQSDHNYMTWATRGSLWEILANDCQVWWGSPPFDHSKLFIVDDEYLSFGSSNWDTRSLRLNFELNIEAFDQQLAAELTRIFENKRAHATPYTLQDHKERSTAVKLRDGFFRLFTPFI